MKMPKPGQRLIILFKLRSAVLVDTMGKKGIWYVLGGVLTDKQEEVDAPRSNASFADTTNIFIAMDTSGTVTTEFQVLTYAIHASFNRK